MALVKQPCAGRGKSKKITTVLALLFRTKDVFFLSGACVGGLMRVVSSLEFVSIMLY